MNNVIIIEIHLHTNNNDLVWYTAAVTQSCSLQQWFEMCILNLNSLHDKRISIALLCCAAQTRSECKLQILYIHEAIHDELETNMYIY